MSAWLLALGLILASALPVTAQEIVRGVVRDPQDRVVAGAEIELSCAGRSSQVLTSDEGLFSFVTPAGTANCDLTVRRPGFEPWRRTVRPPAETIAVKLAIASLRETVNVAPVQSANDWDVSSSLSTSRMSASELHVLGPDSRLWLDLVMNTAGAFVGQRRIYVDGMPVDAAPDAARISNVVVNADPFSAEFGGVDENRIDISTAAPDRHWRFNAGGPTLTQGGGDALVARPPPDTRRRSAGVSGPVPRLPLTFFAQGSTYSATEHPTYLAAQSGAVGLDASAPATSTISAWSVGTSVNRSSVAWQATVDGSEMRLGNAGVGGLTAPAAGLHSASVTRRFLSSWKTSDRAVTHRGGVMLVQDSTGTVANAAGQARTVFGQLNTSGNDRLSDAESATRVYLRHVTEGMTDGRPWSAGIEMSRAVVRDSPVPNPLGRLHLEALDASQGTLVVQRGTPMLEATATAGAMFVQGTPVVRKHVLLRAGLRGDWQAGEGLLVSPRTTLLMRGRGFVIASSAGLFVNPWSPAFLLETVRRDGRVLPTQVVPNVPVSTDLVPDMDAGEPLTLRVAPGLARRRDLVVRTAIVRRIGRVDAGIEHKWTRAVALAGTTRVRGLTGLVDVIDSDRRLARQQLHARAGISSRTLSVTGHYEWVRSLDDTDDAFALPARQDEVGGEWGPSTGIARHNASLVASFTLPGAIHAFVSGTASSGSPYSVVTGRDVQGLAAFTDRAGAPRNSMVGPACRSVSLYASRRLDVPRAHGLAVDVGVRAENVFDWTNVTAIGRVAGTSWLGQPLTALAGRSINVWMSIAR